MVNSEDECGCRADCHTTSYKVEFRDINKNAYKEITDRLFSKYINDTKDTNAHKDVLDLVDSIRYILKQPEIIF